MFSDLSPAIYRVRIVVTDDLEQTGVRRKRIVIPDFDTDENICSVHLINSGVVVTGNDVTVSFREIGVTTGFMCRLDNEERETCKFFIAALTEHLFYIIIIMIIIGPQKSGSQMP